MAWANKWARDNSCKPTALAVYGSGLHRAYAGVWLPNPSRVKWAVAGPTSGAGFQALFDAYGQVPMRATSVDVSDDGSYLAVFEDDSVGAWSARHGMTAAQYQTEFDTQVQKGALPISVQGAGTGSNARYAAVFAAQAEPEARSWTVTGQTSAAVPAFDAAFKRFMVAQGVRAGALGVVKGGTLRLARGYTWAEPTYPKTQPATLFRLASCSKAFACAAIHKLVTDNRLQLSQPVFPLLGIHQAALANQKVDSRVSAITVQQLVEHTGGWDSKLSKFDAVFSMREIALSLGLEGHASKLDLARYMYGQPLDFAPGLRSAYSNFGYVLLGLVVERITGKSFVDYLQSVVLAPQDIQDVFVASTLRSGKRPTEALYDAPGLGASAWLPQSQELAPLCYGGEGWVAESMDTGGGLITSVTSLARFAAEHAAWGLGGRSPGSARSGAMAGVSSLMVSRHDGVDWAYIFNTRTLSSGALDQLGAELDGIFSTLTL